MELENGLDDVLYVWWIEEINSGFKGELMIQKLIKKV